MFASGSQCQQTFPTTTQTTTDYKTCVGAISMILYFSVSSGAARSVEIGIVVNKSDATVLSMQAAPNVVEHFLFDLDQLHVEREHCVGRNNSGMTAAAVSVIWRADQLGTFSDRQLRPKNRNKYPFAAVSKIKSYLGNSLIPTPDHLALADGEPERLSTSARRIEHGSILQGSGVVDDSGLSVLRVGLS